MPLLCFCSSPTEAANSTSVTAAGEPADGVVKLERIIDNPGLRKKKKGAKLRRWITGEVSPTVLHRPYGVAWDGDDLLVTDPGAGRIVRITRRSRVKMTPDGLLESPMGVAVCTRGIVVTDSRSGVVRLLDEALRPVTILADGLDRPTGVACSGDRIYVLETARHRVRVFDANLPGYQRTWGQRGEAPGEFNFPVVAAWHEDTLWVGDTLNSRVQQLDGTTGEALNVFGRLGDAPGDMPRIKGLAIDEQGRVWVSDGHLDLVSLYRPDGALLTHTGRAGAELAFPAGIATHADGRVAVADSLNRRIQIFRVVTASKETGG